MYTMPFSQDTTGPNIPQLSTGAHVFFQCIGLEAFVRFDPEFSFLFVSVSLAAVLIHFFASSKFLWLLIRFHKNLSFSSFLCFLWEKVFYSIPTWRDRSGGQCIRLQISESWIWIPVDLKVNKFLDGWGSQRCRLPDFSNLLPMLCKVENSIVTSLYCHKAACMTRQMSADLFP